MLAASVHSLERFFVQQYAEAVVACYLTHQCHDKHVVVDSQIALLEDRSQLELVGSHFVVTCLYGDTQFQRFDLQFLHEGCHTGRNGTEVMVFQLLVLGRVVSGQGASGHQQVGTGSIQTFVNQEIFLFPTQIGIYFLDVGVEVVAYLYGSLVNCTQCLQQRCLIVE